MRENMRDLPVFVTAVLLLFAAPTPPAALARTQRPLRVAILGFASGAEKVEWKRRGPLESRLATAFGRDRRAALIDDSLTQAALAGLGYDGATNLSREEARGIGAAIGCDFFVLGKTGAFTRSDRVGESHEEAFVGVLIADGRTGRLALFDFLLEKAEIRAAAQARIGEEMGTRAGQYLDSMLAFDSARLSSPVTNREAAEEMPEPNSALAAGFTPPEFINRVKPVYTEEADRADVTATVEALVLFRASGEVGDIDVLRWAGFGLDESSVQAIRQLKFRPATRDGKPITVRALVRYNFRRLGEGDADRKPPAAPAGQRAFSFSALNAISSWSFFSASLLNDFSHCLR